MKKSDFRFLGGMPECAEGAKWFKAQPDLNAVWHNCERPDWMFDLLSRIRPLNRHASVELAITFAERALPVFEKESTSQAPACAIAGAKAWYNEEFYGVSLDELANSAVVSSEFMGRAAEAAALSCASAARAAYAASCSIEVSLASTASAAARALSDNTINEDWVAGALWAARVTATDWSIWATKLARTEAGIAADRARYAIEVAAWPGAPAENKWQCDVIRLLVRNPFL